jgi:hypothetical protein
MDLKDSDGNDLVPGALYAVFTHHAAPMCGESISDTGVFVFFGGDGVLYDADIDDPTEVDPESVEVLIWQAGAFSEEYARLTDPLSDYTHRYGLI